MEAGSGLGSYRTYQVKVGDNIVELRHAQAFLGSLRLFPSVLPPTLFFETGFFSAFLASFWGIGQAPLPIGWR